VHLIALGFVALAITLFALADPTRKWQLPRAISIFVPAILFFWLVRPGLRTFRELTFREFDDKFASLYTVPMHGYSWRIEIFCMFLAVAAIAAALWRNTEIRSNGRMLWVWIALFVAYWFIPQSWGETWDIDVRILPFLFLLILAAV